MNKTTTQITMLGTGNATVSQIYNTCFLLKTPSTLMLVDAGGGNGILSQLKKVNVQISDIHHLFVTHAHTDHVLGVIWVIRMVAQCKGYEGLLHVYGNDKVMKGRMIKRGASWIMANAEVSQICAAEADPLSATSLQSVVTGTPTAPNPVATVLPIKETRAENIGLNPSPMRIAAGIATAVPKPLRDLVPNCLQSFSRLTSSEKTHSSRR